MFNSIRFAGQCVYYGMKQIAFCLFVLLLTCCQPGKKETDNNFSKDVDRKSLADSAMRHGRDTAYRNVEEAAADIWVTCENIEMVPFCVMVPGKNYYRNDATSDVKGKVVYTHKTKADNEVVVQGLLRSDTGVSFDDYYNRSLQAAEEEGAVVTGKAASRDSGGGWFFTKGYMNNTADKYRFLEIVWLRPEDVVVYRANFDAADTTYWYSKISDLLQQGTDCK
jgi:hypothetical protein